MTSLATTNRAQWISAVIAVIVALLQLLECANAEQKMHFEGGSFPVVQEYSTLNTDNNPTTVDDYFGGDAVELQQPAEEPYLSDGYLPGSAKEQQQIAALAQEQINRQRLARIVAQLRQQQSVQQQELADGPGVFVDAEDENTLPEQNNVDWDMLKEFGGEPEETPAGTTTHVGQKSSSKMAAVKKGQSEFVEFVEPLQNSRLNKPEWMEEQRVYTHDESPRSNRFNFFSNSGNLLFMAYLAVCCAGIVAGTFGGIYYYNHVRANRVDDPFNEFTRYSPAGPGKEKLKRSAGSPTFGQTGDDTLAYKAQLQHYQQQKQKILGSASSPVAAPDNLSDAEEDTDEMDHNYSVFECPGLAPTGDLEIQNPNFTGGEKTETVRRAE